MDTDDGSQSDDGSQQSSCLSDFSEDPRKQSSKAPVKGSLKVSDWVVVKYDIASSSKSQSSTQYFVGQILEVISDAMLRITFLRPQYSHKCAQYIWPSHDDIDNCDFHNIVEVLPHPTMTRRGGVTF